MRLFFIGWSGKELGLIDVMVRLKKTHDIVYWSGDRKEFESYKHELPGVIFHEHFDALYGIPAEGVDTTVFLPPGDALLRTLLETESTVLTMMNKRFEGVLVSERKHLYYRHVRYWNGVLETLRPDAIIFPCAPHTVYDFVLYSLAKIRGIPCIFFELTVIGGRSLSMKDFVTGNDALAEATKANAHTSVRKEDLHVDIREYYEWQINKRASHTPAYLTKQIADNSGVQKMIIKLKSVWLNVWVHRNFGAFVKVLTHIPRKFIPNMRKEYSSATSLPDYSRPFLYVPLNYQPERTSSPQGGFFVDQLLMVEILSACLPSDWLIYVKEHPAQWMHRGPDFFSYRYKGFYQSLATLKNVRLVPMDTSTYTLMSKAVVVATVTGTAGFEAVMRSKPVIIFGYPWYQHAPGVLRVSDVPTGKEALKKIAHGFAPSQDDVLQYLFNFQDTSFIGYCEPHGHEVANIGAAKNTERIVKAIETELSAVRL